MTAAEVGLSQFHRFFKMAAASILDFKRFKFLTVGTVKRLNCISVPNFVEIAPNRGRDMAFFGFFKMAAVKVVGSVVVGLLTVISSTVLYYIVLYF